MSIIGHDSCKNAKLDDCASLFDFTNFLNFVNTSKSIFPKNKISANLA